MTKVDQITEKLEQGITELFESERYQNFLGTMGKFHQYSFANTVLICMQLEGMENPVGLVAGYESWKKNFGRQVKKGEKAIQILAPNHFKKEVNKVNDKGEEYKEVITIPAYRAVNVFDLSQTEGKEIDFIQPVDLDADLEGFQKMVKAIEKISPVPIGFEDIESGSHGYFHTVEQRIAIKNGLGQTQTVKTMLHEVAHSICHNLEAQKVDKKGKGTKEVEAESIAYVVCNHFGIDTSDYSFAYIAGWSKGKELKELKAVMSNVRDKANMMITEIEKNL